MSWNRLLLCLLMTSLLLPAVMAGSQTDPEITDPDGDASFAEGECSVAPIPGCATMEDAAASPMAEILAGWISEPDDQTVRFHVLMGAAGDADTSITLVFNVTPTDISLHTGAPAHTISFTITGSAPSAGAPGNMSAVWNGTILEVTVPRADLDAVGGDSITAWAIHASHEHTQTEGAGPLTATRTDTTTDSTSGESRPYNLTRPAIVPDIELDVLGGSLTQTVNGTASTTPFAVNEVTTAGPNATVTFDLLLTNAGTDPDAATIELFDPTGSLAEDNVAITIAPTSVATLLPGQTQAITVTATLADAAVGQHPILLQATSGRGAIAATAMQVTVPAPPAPPVTQPPPTSTTPPPTTGPEPDGEEREPVLAGLSFLTPMAEAMGLDGPFGEYAELVLLAILLLLLILIAFLIVFLLTRGAVAIVVEPRTASARPGETAEFSVEVRNKRGRPLRALTHFEGDPAWKTGLSFGDAQLTQSHADAQLGLGSKDLASGTRFGKLSVTVPADAHADEMDAITVAVSALSDSGRPVKTRKAGVKVRAVGAAAPAPTRGDIPMRLASVTHVPEEPVAGQTVQTTARLENDSDSETLRLRVVLHVDGNDVQEQQLVLPPHSARAVVFAWDAPQGSSKVKVRVYPQD